MRIRGTWKAAGATALAVLLAAGSVATASASARAHRHTNSVLSGTLGFQIDAESWPTLDPASGALHGTDQPIMSMIYGNLITVGPHNTYAPGLLKSYSLSKNAMSFTMTLRPHLKFQDGTRLNSAALKANLERDMSPKLACTCHAFMEAIKSIATPTSTKVVLHFSRPDGTILAALAASSASYVASPSAVRKEGTNFGVHPVGAGPFRVVSNVVSSSITLKRFKSYWDAKDVHVGTINVTSGASGPSEWATLQSGGIQLLGLPFGDPTVEKEAKAASNLQVFTNLGYANFVYMNPGRPPFNNILAREAVQYATDAASISRSLYYGLEPATQQMVGAAQEGYPGNTLPGFRKYDLAKAKALVHQLGGISFSLEGANSPANVQLLEALAKQWSDAGMKVTISQVSETQEITDLTKGNFQAVPAAYAPQHAAALSLSEVLSCPSFFDPYFCDKQAAADLTKAEASANDATQAKYVRAAMKRAIFADAAFAPIVEVPEVMIAPKSVHGLVVEGGQVYVAGITSF